MPLAAVTGPGADRNGTQSGLAGDPPTSAPLPQALFETGRNCCVVATASRVALLVDGEEYFQTFVQAAERATHSIAILAWDFNSNTRLHFDSDPSSPPSRLGDFLNWLVRRKRGLHVHVLDWDYPLVFGIDREFRAFRGFGWRPHRRIHLAYDNTHPVGASHHQKIVVIDDSLAFIGGLDLTVRRWDTSSHSAAENRRDCGGGPYPPFHDVMMAVEGEAARALGKIVRERWRTATGRALPKPVSGACPWPPGLRADLSDVRVALARTLPEQHATPAITEVEALYLDMIAAARKHIYIENQYFTAAGVGAALEARLAEAEGPEIVVVVRLFSHGWLEEHTMHVLRTRLVQRLRAADRHGHFHIYYPHTEGLAEKTCIDLHSKLMIVDDEILRIGSANLSNRSMGMDSECDAAIEAAGDPGIAAVIRRFRNRLLAEHLDTAIDTVESAWEAAPGLHRLIETLGGPCRSLRPLERMPDWPAAMVELARVGDPAQPLSLELPVEGLAEDFSDNAQDPTPDQPGFRQLMRKRLIRLGGFIAMLAAFAALWRYTPLAAWIDANRVSEWATRLAAHPWAPLVVLVAYTPACIVMFPRSLITLGSVVAFGPRLGFVYALSGILVSALATYLAGLGVPRHVVHRMAGKKLLRLADTLRRRSLLAMTALRLVPIAPFAVEGLLAAAIGVRLLPFMLGTLFGMLPGTLAATVFGDQLKVVFNDPSEVSYGVLGAALLGIVLASVLVRRWLVKQHLHSRHAVTK